MKKYNKSSQMEFRLWKTIENEPQNDLKMHWKMTTTTILLARFFNNCIALHFVGKEQEQNKWFKMILVKTNDRHGLYPSISTYQQKILTVLTKKNMCEDWRFFFSILFRSRFKNFHQWQHLVLVRHIIRCLDFIRRWNYYENSLGRSQCLKIIKNVSFEFFNFGIFH